MVMSQLGLRLEALAIVWAMVILAFLMRYPMAAIGPHTPER